MAPHDTDIPSLSLLQPPYTTLERLEIKTSEIPHPTKGHALIWHMGIGDPTRDWKTAHYRPGGIALIVVLPPASSLESRPELLEAVLASHPQSILPFDPAPDIDSLIHALRRPPRHLPIAFTDYLQWRGLRLDSETRRLIQRTIQHAPTLHTVRSLSRSLYLSRRALGRRFLTRGLPVPSHWLHFARVLHTAIQIQNRNDSVFQIAVDYGYPDGFSLSNQMKRLTGIRPTEVRDCLGWQWLIECWLDRERVAGALQVPLTSFPSPVGSDGSARLPGQPVARWASRSSAPSAADSDGITKPPDSARNVEPQR